MSLTVSRGLTDAARWTAVAAALVEYLGELNAALTRRATPPAPPTGAIRAAKHFFQLVLTGIAVDEQPSRRRAENGSATGQPVPTMAGISNLTIAKRVMQSSKPSDLSEIKERVTSLMQTLEALGASRPRIPRKDRRHLAKFLSELQRQGEAQRYATLTAQERPRPVSVF